jgi:hypothetical protein
MSSDTDDSPFYIPTRSPPRPPNPPPTPVSTVVSPPLPAIHIHLAAPQEPAGVPVSARPWYFTGSGLLWLLFSFAIMAGAGYLAYQYLQGWL